MHGVHLLGEATKPLFVGEVELLDCNHFFFCCSCSRHIYSVLCICFFIVFGQLKVHRLKLSLLGMHQVELLLKLHS